LRVLKQSIKYLTASRKKDLSKFQSLSRHLAEYCTIQHSHKCQTAHKHHQVLGKELIISLVNQGSELTIIVDIRMEFASMII